MKLKHIFNLNIIWSIVLLSCIIMACGEEEVTIEQEPVVEEIPPPTGGSTNTDEDRYVYVAVNERINDIWVPRIYGPGNIPSEMTDGRKDSGIEAMGMDENR
ncbi:MAG TPA: hypothetical protein VGK59_22420, partial [Ohtaekwangia sp.]